MGSGASVSLHYAVEGGLRISVIAWDGFQNAVNDAALRDTNACDFKKV